jgi:hypothetical protein
MRLWRDLNHYRMGISGSTRSTHQERSHLSIGLQKARALGPRLVRTEAGLFVTAPNRSEGTSVAECSLHELREAPSRQPYPSHVAEAAWSSCDLRYRAVEVRRAL